LKDEDYMALAIEMAKSTKGQTSPNPLVGAVIVKDQAIVGLGAHLKAGEPHAEVHALRMAREKAKGSTLYVTLEPCNHHGKTPPCTEQIIQSGIRRVVIASLDPNPLVKGSGIKRLNEAGLTVEFGLLREEAEALNDVFFHYIRTGRPFVTLKTAVSLDGKIATASGESRWITGEDARRDVHRLRHEHDAILVGVGTVIQDNPRLSVRLPEGGKNPIRIILDSHLRTPMDAHVIQDMAQETWIITTKTPAKKLSEPYLQKPNVKIIPLETETIAIPDLLSRLGKLGITSLLVEGGSKVNGSFIQSKMVNQVVMYTAPIIIGGTHAPPAIGGEGFRTLQEAMSLRITSVTPIGKDLKIVAVKAEEELCLQES